jgi:DHA2 family multidrug resistance protein-like MFS transporter
MVRLTYPPNLLGRGLGLNTMMASLGAAIAPPLSGLVLAYTSWQAVFVVGVPLAVVGLVAIRALPDPEPHDEPFDRGGAVMCAVTFGLLISSLQALGQGAPAAIVAGGLIAGAIAATVFVRHASRTRRPVLPIDLLAQPALALSVASALCAVLSSTVVLLYLPFHLNELGFGSAVIGAMIAPYATAVIIFAPASGMLSDKVAPAVLGTVGMVLAVGGVVSLALLPASVAYFDVAWRTALCGLGFSMFFSPNGRLVVGTVSRNRAAGASSLLATTRMFGQALGSTALAALLALSLSIPAPTAAAIILAVLALIFSAARIAVKPTQTISSASASQTLT